MSVLNSSKRLKKELTLFNIYTIATGATIASGFFLLPGLAFTQAGPAMLLSYLIAAIPVIPALFNIAELSTAMPRAGGVYFFLDRSMGPLMGTIGGLGTWLALVLKTSFALVGIGAYTSFEHRRGRKPHAGREFHVGYPAVSLQYAQYLAIDFVQ